MSSTALPTQMESTASRCRLSAILVTVCLATRAASAGNDVSPAAAPAPPDFLRDVRPLLARHCFKCHGPDEKARKAGLRLDVREEALQPTESGETPIVPGKPEESELVRRITTSERGDMMPPSSEKNPLSDAAKETLQRWIAAGAEYRPHWAFVPPRQAPLPEVRRRDWPRNAVDQFVLQRLEKEGLEPSPPADRYTLARRIFLDVIGLPPEPEEADDFAFDDSPLACERLADRLLASPRYGERWARRWLDLARYADTNGYEKDRPRSIWPYRDWVIGALNADMPFDQFTVEQLAGDMLPGATPDQRVATGFHRNTMINEEGGIDPLEFRFYAVVDRANTTATTWLGLTLGCAQCHTHKYDPIPHREYYQFLAYLNNADEPEIEVPDPAAAPRREEIERRIAALEAELPGRFPLGDEPRSDDAAGKAAAGSAADPAVDSSSVEERRRAHLERRFQEWLDRESSKARHWTVLRPSEARSDVPVLLVQDDDSVLATSDQTKSDLYELTFRADLAGVTAVRLDALPDDRLPRRGPGRVYYEGPIGDFWLSTFSLAADGKAVKIARATQTFANGENTAAKAIDADPQSGWSINGGQGRAQSAVFQLAEPIADAGAIEVRLLFERYYAAGLGRFRISVTTDPRPVEALHHPAEVEALLVAPAAGRSAADREKLLGYFVSVAPELAAERKAIEKLRSELPPSPTTLVLAERPAQVPRRTHVHHRGEFLKPRDPVEPALPAVLGTASTAQPRDRLELARWLTSSLNPLAGRVTVNRHWAVLLGRGLVRTSEDFGFQGELPTHPELLDWLAVEFLRRGGSLKDLTRRIVTSAVYRQSSRVAPELLRRDPENRLLARIPRPRLEAELLRDAALRASGLLSTKLGGPSVFPPQPASITKEGTYGPLEWKASEGEDRYRRGLYTFAKRTAPFAMAAAFDAPSGEACTARREASNTPLQALTLLNDEVFVEAARELGRRAAAISGDRVERARWLFRRVLTRPPEAEEVERIVAFYDAQRRRLEAGELGAGEIAGGGHGAVERAAWTLLARALLSLDEAVTRG